MFGIVKRFAEGKHSWLGDGLLRVAGAGLLLASFMTARWMWWREHMFPPHQASPPELGVAAVIVVFLFLGIALSIEGAGLFQQQPRPPRSCIQDEDR